MVDIGGLFGKNDKQNPWIARGEQAYDKGQYEDAAQHFTKALELEPASAKLWTRLAASQRFCQKCDAASRSYAKAVELNPDDGQAWKSLALLLGDAGKYEEALSALGHVVLPDSEVYLKERKYEWLRQSGRYRDAAAVCSQLIAVFPGNIQYRAGYADLLMRSGMFAEARSVYDDLASSLGKPEMFSNAAFCCEMTGDVEGALKRYANLAENDTVGWYRRARLEESLGNFKNASAAYGMIQHYTTGDDVTITVRRALSFYWDGNGKEAAIQLEKVLAKGYANAELWHLLGTISFLNGEFRRAVEAFVEYIHLNQTNNAVWYMKGCAEYLSGKYKEALESFGKMGKLGSAGPSPAKMKWFEDSELDLFDSGPSQKEQIKVEVGVVNEGLLSMQGYALAALGRYGEADKAAGVVLSHAPARLDMELLHSRCLAGLGRYQYAGDAAARVLAKSPENIAALEQHAASMMLAGKYREAAGSWKKLLEASPENTLAYIGLLKACSGTGRYEEAQEIAKLLLSEEYLPRDITVTLLAGEAAASAGNYEEAVTHYQNAAALSSNTPAAFIGLGSGYEMLGEYEKAVEAFSSADEILPDQPGILLALGRARAAAGQSQAAAETYIRIMTDHPDIAGAASHVTTLCADLGLNEQAADAALAALSKGEGRLGLLTLGGDLCRSIDRLDQAQECYTAALKEEPDNIHNLYSIGHVHLLKGEFKLCTEYMDQCLEHEPEHSQALFDKGAAYVNLGRLEDAAKVLRHLTEIDETNTKALLQLAEILEQLHNYDEVLEVYARYLNAGVPNADVVRKLASIYLMRGEYEEALSGYELLIESNPDDIITHRLRAEAFRFLGRDEEAAEACAKMLALRPNDQNIRSMYAASLANIGKTEEALKQYAELTLKDPENTAALFGYAEMLSRMGKYPEAIRYFDKLIGKYPRNSLLHLEKALASIKIGEPKDITSDMTTAAQTDPKNPYVLSGLGFMQMVTGHPTEALAAFDKAEAAGCKDPDLNFCRGIIYLQQSRFDMAEKAADHILKTDQDHLPAMHLKARSLESVGRLKEAVGYYDRIVELSETREDPETSGEE
ncbi:tetratricopeptide repeat protein [Methanocorpusculum parvum]|uniref:Tetratricopeptide repeat protein n=1 Tax=Methanocorpusculum parvum TaxID=2193 RepID=A0AAX0Q775_9EURY|nr:tetratricopeptide repeat protein [Methanocorpusculum parvum]PAV09147.1 hypothetical protein ASJ83_01925 [Methanocorpusculum parvum]